MVYRFDTPEYLASWEHSDVRAALLARGAAFTKTIAERRLDALGSWFAPAERPTTGPPRWKTFVMTATVIVVLQTAVSAALGPLLAGRPTLLRTGLVIVTVVALMTWLVMPRLSRWLGQWLYRSRRDAPELTPMSNGDNA